MKPTHERERSTPLLWFALAMALMLAALLRLQNFSQLVLIDDEWHALHALMSLSYAELFTSFGFADRSIPIALWLKWLSEQFGLTEWRIGLPFLIAGVAATVLMPQLFRPWLRRDEMTVFAVLLATSSLMIYYSQQARPYALLALTVPIAIVQLWRFRADGALMQLLAFVLAAVLSAWMHPLMMAWLGWALVFALVFSLWDGLNGHGWSAGLRVLLAGVLWTALTAALLYWPVMNDLASLQSKTGTDSVEWSTFWIAWQLFIGQGQHWMGLIAAALAAVGAVRCYRRDAAFMLYWCLLTLGSLVMIAATDAAWLHHGLVLARYAVPLNVLLLALIGVGLIGVVRSLSSPMLRSMLVALLLLGWVAASPLAEIQLRSGAWAKHLYYQFDYNTERSLYRQHLDPLPIPAAYQRMAEVATPGRVFEAGWWFESHYNPLVRYQRVHQRELKIVMLNGTCMDWTYGEFPYPAASAEPAAFQLERFVFLADLEQFLKPGDFLVFQQRSALPELRERPDPRGCIEFARQRIGPAWHEDADRIVFRRPWPDASGD
ncbi:MAG: hypothetical protein AAGH65_08890 [Pseudomonadota bacterium]